MKKITKFIKKHLIMLTTLLFSTIIISVIYKLQKVSPFGKNSLLTIDFFHQYGPMLGELFDRIKNGDNLVYSFYSGLGIPFYRNFFNYLSSPFNIFLFLFKKESLLTSYSIIIALKAIASSLTCSYYFKKKFNIKSLYLVPLSLLYAFCGYFTAYYWNIMWLDGLVFLPLITLGIENIVNKNKIRLYIISLSSMLFANYFIAYMICIFSCLYFIAYLIIKTDKINIKEILKKVGLFTLSSLISGLLMAWFLLPLYNALKTTGTTGSSFPTSQYYYFSIPEFIKNHLTGIYSTVLKTSTSNCPNISCGIISIGLLTLFLQNKKINLKTKIVYTLLLLLISLSFYIAPLDYIWHAFHVPNDLPYRYSFIYTFILLIIDAYSLKEIKNIKMINIIISYTICILLTLYTQLTNYNNITLNMIKINYLLITTFLLIFILYKNYPKLKKLSILFFIIVISIECILTVNHNWDISQKIEDFYKNYNITKKTIDYINKNDSSKFYRIEKTDLLTLNDASWYNYYGQTTFSSMAYKNIAELNHDLGMPGNNLNSYYYKQNTPIYDLMFNIKYTIGSNNDNVRYTTINKDDLRQINTFNYNIGLMFGVNKGLKYWENNYINPLEYQNDFIEYSTNVENTLERLALINKETMFSNNKTLIKFTYTNNFDNIYLYYNDPNIDYIVINNTVYYNKKVDIKNIQLETKKEIYNYIDYNEPYIINTLCGDDTIDVYVKYNNYLNEEIDIYTLNNKKFIKAYNILNTNKLIITNFSEKIIETESNYNEDKIIYTSIPYDTGWKVYINNKEIKTNKLNNSLLYFKVNKGKNKIVLKYKINNYLTGNIISISTLLTLIIVFIVKKRLIIN